MTGKGHPLPGSGEARHNEIPEHLERDKGVGDDAKARVQPSGEPVTPDGETYHYDDLGRGPKSAGEADELKRDQVAHQDRGHAQVSRAPHASLSGGQGDLSIIAERETDRS